MKRLDRHIIRFNNLHFLFLALSVFILSVGVTFQLKKQTQPIKAVASTKTVPTDSAWASGTLSNTSVSSNTVVLSQDTSYQGTGADGALSTTGTFNINTQTNGNGGRTAADGVNFSVTENRASGTNQIVVSTTPTGLAVNDEILIINLQGTSANNSNVGQYETKKITAISTNNLTLGANLTNGYDGTTQKIMVQRIPNYTNVTVNSGHTLTANAWDGTKGGVLLFRASGTVTVSGTIDMGTKGYRGGAGGSSGAGGQNGESYDGYVGAGGNNATAGTSGGGSGNAKGGASPAGTRGGGAGGGGNTQGQADDGGGGAGGGGYGSGGGGGGGAADCSVTGGLGGAGGTTADLGGGGGGGTNACGTNPSTGGRGGAAGANGTNGSGTNGYIGAGGTAGSGTSTGQGGGSYTLSGAGLGAGGGGGGGSYGVANLTKLYLGSGGGGGGGWNPDPPAPSGVAGGGIVGFFANTMTNSNLISSNGGNAVVASTRGGGGGGGTGGSILIQANTITTNNNITATGGSSSSATGGAGGAGGGSIGRIRLEGTATGTTNPTASTGSISTSASGTHTSAVIDLTSSLTTQVNTFTNLTVTQTVASGQSIKFRTRTGGVAIPDGTWSDWSGVSLSGSTGTMFSPPNRYIQVEATLTGDGTATPTLTSYVVNYSTETTSNVGNTTKTVTSPGGDYTFDANGSLATNVTADSGSVILTNTSSHNTGTGNDGALTVNGVFNVNTQTNGNGGRTAADAVNFSVTENRASGTNQIVVSTTPTGLAVNDEILIINLQGASGDNANVGKYETKKITAISSNTLTLDANLTNSYNGTTQKIMVQRVPQYTSVTINGIPTTTNFDYDNFEGGPGSSDDWQLRNYVDPDITSSTAFLGTYSLHMGHGWGRNFETGSGEPTNTPYDTNTYPYTCMAYKIPSTTRTNMLIYVQNINLWKSITMTAGESPTGYPKVATWNPLQIDNQWHYKCINLDQQLDTSLGTGQHTIGAVIWHGDSAFLGGDESPNGMTGEFWIDEFKISAEDSTPGTLTTSSWDGTKGGVLFFRVNGTLTNNGVISAEGLGYRGAPRFVSTADYVFGYIGESMGAGYQSVRQAAGVAMGGGSGNGQAGGAGGSYFTLGGNGINSGCVSGGPAASSNTGGSANLDTLLFGGSGGAAGSHNGNSRDGAQGGASGGILSITASTVNNSGIISSSGRSGENGYRASASVAQPVGGGGGGAGGSLSIAATTASLGTNKVLATGGSGGVNSNYTGCSPSGAGGAGGSGRIVVNSGTITGSTSPTYTPVSSPGSGTYVSPEIDLAATPNALNYVAAGVTLPTNTTMSLETATSATSGSGYSSYQTVSNGVPQSPANRYIKIRATLSNTDGVGNPTLSKLTVGYTVETTIPTNPTTITSSLSASSNGVAVNQTSWYRYTQPYFTWNAGTDSGNNFYGYCVAFSTDVNTDPGSGCTTANATTNTNYTANLSTTGTYYLLIKSIDAVNNKSASVWNAFTYKFDNTPPTVPSSVSAIPSTWSSGNNFSFNWTGSTDAHSGGVTYKYKVGSDGNEVNPTTTSASSVQATSEGTNNFYVKAVDTTGNESAFTSATPFYYDTTAPVNTNLNPQVTGNPTTNVFNVTWTHTTDSSSGLKGYYYSVNTPPTIANTIYTPNNSLANLNLATQTGTNTFYLVSVDNAGNANFNSPANVNFTSNKANPSAPRNLEITDLSSGSTYSLGLIWKAPTNGTVSKYEIYRTAGSSNPLSDTQQALDSNYSLLTSPTAVGYTDSSLDSTKYYYYKVRAVDSSNSAGIFTSVMGMKPGSKDKTAPTISSVTAGSLTSKTVTITWNSDEVGDSLVEYGTTNSYELGATGLKNSVTSHSVKLEDLNPNTTYHYRVVSSDASNNMSTPSSDATFKTKTTDDSTGPTISSVEVAETATNSAVINWNTDEAATGKIEYGTSSSLGSSVEETSEAENKKHSVLLTSLSPNTLYYYKAISKDSSGNESSSAAATLTTSQQKTTGKEVPKITGLGQVTGVTATSALFSWVTDRGANSYVTYGKVSGTYSSQQGNFEEEVTTHVVTLSGLAPANTYYFKVKSKDSVTGNVGESDEGLFKTKDKSTLSDVVISDISLNSAILSWTTNVVTTSIVKIGTVPNQYLASFKEESTDKTLTHVARISNLSSGTKYFLRISGLDSDNKEFESDEYSFTTNALPVISKVEVKQAENARAIIVWLTNIPTDSTILYGKEENQYQEETTKSDLVTSHEVTLLGLDPNTNYYFKVKGRDKVGNITEKEGSKFLTGKDITPPVITDIKSETLNIGSGETARTQLIVNWTTDEPSTSKVEYGSGLGGSSEAGGEVGLGYTDSTTEDPTYNQTHVVIISNLKPTTTYHFKVVSKDKSNNESFGEDFTIITPPREESTIQTIVKSWEDAFSWVPNLSNVFNLSNIFSGKIFTGTP